ncbi:hypothetical protein JW859_10345 [bacterium]|nr:hypothetical protein [bacterium]
MATHPASTCFRLAYGLILAACLFLAACPSGGASPVGGTDGKTTGGHPATTIQRPQVTVDPGPKPAAATLAYIGNFRGFQKPCGCAVQQSGGLFRLGSVSEQLDGWFADPEKTIPLDGATPLYEPPEDLVRPEPLWFVECGNFADPNAHFPVERVKTHLAALEHLIPRGLKAAVLGSSELQLPVAHVREAFAETAVPIVSCNVTCDPALLTVKPYQQMAEGWYLTGLTTWKPATIDPPEEPWWTLADPLESVAAVAAGLPADANLIVVAMYQDAEVIRQAAALPAVAVVIGHSSEFDKQWTEDLAPAIGNPPAKGLSLRLLSLTARTADGRGTVTDWDIPLADGWADEQFMVELVDAERDLVRQKLTELMAAKQDGGWENVDWGSAEKYLPDKEAKWEFWAESPPHYLGSRACVDCHPQIYASWLKTRHAEALVSLMQKQEHETLDCLSCHVTGLLEPSGYNPDAPEKALGAVSCESCHGPGSVHAGLQALGRETGDQHIIRGTLEGCLDCHDEYNSPAFEATSYWQKIKHQTPD